jgi:hypothetical protein
MLLTMKRANPGNSSLESSIPSIVSSTKISNNVLLSSNQKKELKGTVDIHNMLSNNPSLPQQMDLDLPSLEDI